MFRVPIAVAIGETVTRDGFVFCDLLPADVMPAGAGIHDTGRDSERLRGSPSSRR